MCAQNKDQMFISNYARDFPTSEDAAESIVPWYASRYSAYRVPQETLNKIHQAIPNRLKYFDDRFLQQPSGIAVKRRLGLQCQTPLWSYPLLLDS